LQPKKQGKNVPFTPKTLEDIVADLCSFIMREIIPTDGAYFDHEGDLASDNFRVLIDIAGLNLKRNDM